MIESIEYKIRMPRLRDVYPSGYRGSNTLKNYKLFISRVKKIEYLRKQLRKAKISFKESMVFDSDCRGYLIITNA